MNNHKQEWEQSYRNKDNFVFFPHEEVIRFVSKYFRKMTGFGEFRDIVPLSGTEKALDVGCGIGRHLIYLNQMGFDAYGIDLSEEAVSVARGWATSKGVQNAEDQIVVGDTRSMPWPDDMFLFAVSHGVLDSMYFDIAKATMQELHRVLVPRGLFYCDLIAGEAVEEIVETAHEKGTVQSYFDLKKIESLAEGLFEIEECTLITRKNVQNETGSSRYHLVLRKK
jgi:SAM-dependent methyltransferase